MTSRRSDATDEIDDLERQIAEALTRTKRTAASAESLTGGNVSAGLSAIEGASDWFLGGVVAYAEEVKYDPARRRPRAGDQCETAQQMAKGAARLLHADFAVATTGVGGPGPQEGPRGHRLHRRGHAERFRRYASTGSTGILARWWPRPLGRRSMILPRP